MSPAHAGSRTPEELAQEMELCLLRAFQHGCAYLFFSVQPVEGTSGSPSYRVLVGTSRQAFHEGTSLAVRRELRPYTDCGVCLLVEVVHGIGRAQGA
jgi:hypothetical protein